MRRDMYRLMACGMALALLAAGGPAGAQQGPIKIGLIVPLTGVFSPNGRDMANGFTLALGQVGNRAAGREIQVVKMRPLLRLAARSPTPATPRQKP